MIGAVTLQIGLTTHEESKLVGLSLEILLDEDGPAIFVLPCCSNHTVSDANLGQAPFEPWPNGQRTRLWRAPSGKCPERMAPANACAVR